MYIFQEMMCLFLRKKNYITFILNSGIEKKFLKVIFKNSE